MSAIVAENLVKHFSPTIRAVDGVDLDVPEGQIFGYLGQNGSGKTTTVRMLTTLLKPTSGRAEVNGIDVRRHPGHVRRTIGVALQEAGLDELQTGRELLELQASLFGMRGRKGHERAAELLRIVDLEEAAARRIDGYSGGMRRRLDLAAALVHRPKVVFLDEPTTGLDPVSRDAVWRYVRELNSNDGVTFFLTTQYLEEADRLADDLAIMEAGKIIARGTPSELKASIGTDVVSVDIEGGRKAVARAAGIVQSLEGIERLQTLEEGLVVYIAEGARAISRIVLLLDEANIVAGGITLARPTLDDVFLRMTGHHLLGEKAGARPDGPKQETH